MEKVELKKDAPIIMMRGLGFSHEEISEQLDIKRSTVQYRLKKIKTTVIEDYNNNWKKAFWALLIGGGLATLLYTIYTLKKKK